MCLTLAAQRKHMFLLFTMASSSSPSPDYFWVAVKNNNGFPFLFLLFRLVIEPDLVSGRTNGSVTVALSRDPAFVVMQPIVFDISDIQVAETSVISAVTGNAIPYEASYGERNETFRIALKKSREDYTDLKVKMIFRGRLTNTMQGIYRGQYKDTERDTSQNYVSTQFSPIDARKAFPCMDRPDKKANFTISLVRPMTMQTFLSNMRHLSST